MATEIIHHPASLFIGTEQELLENTISLLQSVLCASVMSGESNQGCSVCIQCRKVQEQQHESILWLMPEKQYAVEDLKPIFCTISYALEADQHYFIVIQNHVSCQNSDGWKMV